MLRDAASSVELKRIPSDSLASRSVVITANDGSRAIEDHSDGKRFGKLALLSESFSKMAKDGTPSTIHALFTLSAEPSEDDLTSTLQRLMREFPLFSARPSWRGGLLGYWDALIPSALRGNRWKYSRDSVKNHIKRATIGDGKRALEDYVSSTMTAPLPSSGGLWEIHIITRSNAAECYMLWRLSHAIGDGVILTKALLALCTKAEEIDKKEAGSDLRKLKELMKNKEKKKKKKKANIISVACGSVKALLKLSALGCIPSDADSAVRLSSSKNMGAPKSFRFSQPMSLARAKVASITLSVTINDIITASISEAMESTAMPSQECHQKRCPSRCAF